MQVKNAVECKTMEEAIEKAKKQVKDWYTPDTKRVWIENIFAYSIPENNNRIMLKVFALSGGEPKGTVIANYHDWVVIAFNFGYTKMKIYNIPHSGMPYSEQVFNTSRYPRD
jgi:hypothetical protein